MPIQSCDIFCTVVDNFGDIGVCWRLARQLSQEHGHAVRLWVDDLGSFARLAPEIDPARACQHLGGVEVRRWDASPGAPFEPLPPHDLVIEAFACHLPEPFLAAMAAAPRPPVWINLEYLSAEAWVSEHHALSSPHPKLPLGEVLLLPRLCARHGRAAAGVDAGRAARCLPVQPRRAIALWYRLGTQPAGRAAR